MQIIWNKTQLKIIKWVMRDRGGEERHGTITKKKKHVEQKKGSHSQHTHSYTHTDTDTHINTQKSTRTPGACVFACFFWLIWVVVTRNHESRHGQERTMSAYERVMFQVDKPSPVWLSNFACQLVTSHVTDKNKEYDRVVQHISMSHVTHTNESCNTFEEGMWQVSMMHCTHVSESFHTHK